MIYLDNNATTKVAPEVMEAMIPFFTEYWGNPSSKHPGGSSLTRYMERAREQVAKLIGAKRPSEIVFTSSGTESDTTAILSALHTQPQKRHIITTLVEHSAVLSLCRRLENEGYEVTYLPVNREGLFQSDEFKASLRSDTALVTVMWVNNETGVIFPIEDIAPVCEAANIPLHVDAVQAVGKLPIDLSKVPITFLSLSGHKFHASKGIGALYVRRGTPFYPLFLGHQEMERRGGTENVPGIIGLGKASELAYSSLNEDMPRLRRLRDKLEERLLEVIPRAFVNGHKTLRIPTTSNIMFEQVEGEALLILLGEKDICVSSGSACSSGSLEPSHVLKAMHKNPSRESGIVRLSLSRYTTEAEINEVISVLPPLIQKLRGRTC